MKRYGHLIVVLCAALVCCGVVPAHAAEQDKTSREFREQFIKEFNRTGMDTTVGDAMMLRILVESARCKRGVEVGSFKGFGTWIWESVSREQAGISIRWR